MGDRTITDLYRGTSGSQLAVDDDRRLTIRPMTGNAQRTIALIWRQQDPRDDAYRLLPPAIRRHLPASIVRAR